MSSCQSVSGDGVVPRTICLIHIPPLKRRDAAGEPRCCLFQVPDQRTPMVRTPTDGLQHVDMNRTIGSRSQLKFVIRRQSGAFLGPIGHKIVAPQRRPIFPIHDRHGAWQWLGHPGGVVRASACRFRFPVVSLQPCRHSRPSRIRWGVPGLHGSDSLDAGGNRRSIPVPARPARRRWGIRRAATPRPLRAPPIRHAGVHDTRIGRRFGR